MAYDDVLVERIREVLTPNRLNEKRLFGGLAFLVDGNMAVAASRGGGLMVRVPAEDMPTLLRGEHVEPMVMAGRERRGWVRVLDDGLRTRRQLESWVTRGVDHARTLPPK